AAGGADAVRPARLAEQAQLRADEDGDSAAELRADPDLVGRPHARAYVQRPHPPRLRLPQRDPLRPRHAVDALQERHRLAGEAVATAARDVDDRAVRDVGAV